MKRTMNILTQLLICIINFNNKKLSEADIGQNVLLLFFGSRLRKKVAFCFGASAIIKNTK
jgi:hypothetical protein